MTLSRVMTLNNFNTLFAAAVEHFPDVWANRAHLLPCHLGQE